MSWGPNLLIKQGAKLVQEWNDVVTELKPEDRRRLVDQCRNRLKEHGLELSESTAANPASITTGPMQGVARAVLGVLKLDLAIGLDHLMETVGQASPSEVIAVLFELELAGLVRQVPGKRYMRVWAD
jgi:DNA processing protein